MAAKPKLTDELVEQLCSNIKLCGTRETACGLAGIASRTLRIWAEQASKDAAKGRATKYTRFAEKLAAAECENEMLLVKLIVRAANGAVERRDKDGNLLSPQVMPDWKAAAWILERAHRSRWGYKAGLELTGADGAPLIPGVVILPPEDAPPEDG